MHPQSIIRMNVRLTNPFKEHKCEAAFYCSLISSQEYIFSAYLDIYVSDCICMFVCMFFYVADGKQLITQK